MRIRVYETERRPSVSPSQHGPTAANPLLLALLCCGFDAVGPVGRRNRSIAARPAPCECGQCHVVSVRTVTEHRLVLVIIVLLSIARRYCKAQ